MRSLFCPQGHHCSELFGRLCDALWPVACRSVSDIADTVRAVIEAAVAAKCIFHWTGQVGGRSGGVSARLGLNLTEIARNLKADLNQHHSQ
jgi:hypothetical protein